MAKAQRWKLDKQRLDLALAKRGLTRREVSEGCGFDGDYLSSSMCRGSHNDGTIKDSVKQLMELKYNIPYDEIKPLEDAEEPKEELKVTEQIVDAGEIVKRLDMLIEAQANQAKMLSEIGILLLDIKEKLDRKPTKPQAYIVDKKPLNI